MKRNYKAQTYNKKYELGQGKHERKVTRKEMEKYCKTNDKRQKYKSVYSCSTNLKQIYVDQLMRIISYLNFYWSG